VVVRSETVALIPMNATRIPDRTNNDARKFFILLLYDLCGCALAVPFILVSYARISGAKERIRPLLPRIDSPTLCRNPEDWHRFTSTSAQ